MRICDICKSDQFRLEDIMLKVTRADGVTLKTVSLDLCEGHSIYFNEQLDKFIKRIKDENL